MSLKTILIVVGVGAVAAVVIKLAMDGSSQDSKPVPNPSAIRVPDASGLPVAPQNPKDIIMPPMPNENGEDFVPPAKRLTGLERPLDLSEFAPSPPPQSVARPQPYVPPQAVARTQPYEPPIPMPEPVSPVYVENPRNPKFLYPNTVKNAVSTDRDIGRSRGFK